LKFRVTRLLTCQRHYAAFHTGPSATADIEGVLIHGAQGVRSLFVLPIARATGNITH
jgi:L-lactate dehydrogenase complex protein LldG